MEHKVGVGGFSTVWLARDKESGRLLTLKAMRADASSKLPKEIPELVVPRSLRAAFPDSRVDFQTVKDHFNVCGPNHSHQFLTFPLPGPSVLVISTSPHPASPLRSFLALQP